MVWLLWMGCFILSFLVLFLVKDLIQLPWSRQYWMQNAATKQENYFSVELWLFIKKKKFSWLRINSQTLIYYIHLCHLHISISHLIQNIIHFPLQVAYIYWQQISANETVNRLSTPCWTVSLVLNISQT